MNIQQAAVKSCQDVWMDHVRKAVLKFLKTAVVVDNDPRENTPPTPSAPSLSLAVEDSGLGNDAYVIAEENTPPLPNNSQNILDIRKISDSFSENGMACAFVLPEDSDTNEERIRKRVVLAAKTADILVIDWHLRPKSSSLTLKLLREIAESDASENGRMRLVCIYTGEPLDSHILDQAKQELSVQGVQFSNVDNIADFPFCAKSKNSLIVIANKSSTQADVLPVKLIDIFAILANGLIPAFALAAIGAVRKNTHHMLTRFGEALDPAYIANRLITNPPGDVAELMRELLVAECDNAIGLDSVADDFLEPDAITAWLNMRDINSFHYRVGTTDPLDTLEFDRTAINGLLTHGINDHGIKISNSVSRKFPAEFRGLVSHVLAGSVEKSRNAENEFSRLVAFRREASGASVSTQAQDWLPSLTTGTLLKSVKNGEAKYLFCFSPACDMLRLNGPRPFVFIEGVRKNSPYNMIVLDGDVEVPVFFDKNYPTVITYSFKPEKKLKRVRGSKVITPGAPTKYIFKPEGSAEGDELTWLGEVRYGRAMSEMATLASRWMRVGIIDSENLRLAGRKTFPFV
ncbi:response regulator receiver domain [Pseudomonas sp. B21-012]|uniref:response regulator receiver domain n=1 Tax=Pseudomonas sp. B21-012 TaxID=2895472 RepID=UPI002160A455|nr:response regulator receiver domain [Pseudomonas sp. B21-012]UVM54084.1 response regulator receiver domain [Pseudomonas sp. B21-012]